MKTTISSLSALAVLICGLLIPATTGCRSPGATGTNTSIWQDPVFVANTALAVKATVANGVAIAITEDSNAQSYCELAEQVLLKIVGGADYAPGTLETALSKIPVQELKGKYARIAITNIGFLYEVYWGQVVRDNVDADPIASKLLQAAIDGIKLGLAGNAPASPPAPVGTQAYRAQKK